MQLKKVLHQRAIAIQANGTLEQAVELMQINHVGSVIVVDKMNGVSQTAVGILTDRDITLYIAKTKSYDPQTPIKTVMTKNIIKCDPDEEIHQAVIKMRANGIRRIPLVNKNNQLEGVVSSDDLFRYLTDELRDLSLIITNEIVKEGQSRRNRAGKSTHSFA